MMKRPFAEMASVGVAVPPGVLTNADLTRMLDTSDEWIVERTGIRERHIATADQSVAMLSCEASEKALERAGLTAKDLDAIVLGTASPDRLLPSTACDLQALLGADNAAAFDIAAACPGFVFATTVAEGLIASGQSETVLVVGAEKLSTITDFQDRSTAILFGDGAGAAILQSRSDTHGLLTACMGADGSKGELLSMPAGGSRQPATIDSVNSRLHYLRMDGKETFKSAVNAMYQAAQEALRRCEIDITQIKLVIPHQANRRIIDAVGERLGARPDQVFVNLHKFGNTSAASVAIALDEAVTAGLIQRGDLVLLVVFGAGLTWGAAVIQW